MNTTKITFTSLTTNVPTEFEFFPVYFQGEDFFGLHIGGELVGLYRELPSESSDADVVAGDALKYLFVEDGDYYLEVARETTNQVLIIADDSNQKPVMFDDLLGEFLEVRSGAVFTADDAEQYIATPFGWKIDVPENRETIHTYSEILSHASS